MIGSAGSIKSVIMFLTVLIFVMPISSNSQRKVSLETRVHKLEKLVQKMSDQQRTLEARIAVLEQLHLTPPPQVLRQGYITSSRDAIISNIVNLSVNAYQYRIRPTQMAGGGGTYNGYKIPKALSSSQYATVTAQIFPDSVIFLGVSNDSLGSVQGTLHSTGEMGAWTFTGDFE